MQNNYFLDETNVLFRLNMKNVKLFTSLKCLCLLLFNVLHFKALITIHTGSNIFRYFFQKLLEKKYVSSKANTFTQTNTP